MNGDWIKFSEKRPSQKENVLFTDGEDYFAGYIEYYDEQSGSFYIWSSVIGGYDCDVFIDQDNVTHWMPLPKLP